MTTPLFPHYDALAALFDYPAPDYPQRARAARGRLAERFPLAAMAIEVFVRALPPSVDGHFTPAALDEAQELYTRSFDVQAITTLGVGYVMFGDDYKRGELLVHLSREMAAAGVDCGSELPDHLPNVLRLMAWWQDRTLALELAREILQPALVHMISEFDSQRRRLRDGLYEKHFKTLIASSEERGAIFREPLAAALGVLQEELGLPDWRPTERDNDFLSSLGRELEIEKDEETLVQLGKSS